MGVHVDHVAEEQVRRAVTAGVPDRRGRHGPGRGRSAGKSAKERAVTSSGIDGDGRIRSLSAGSTLAGITKDFGTFGKG